MKKTNSWMKRPALAVAVLALCLCLPIAGVAMGNAGFFKDITRWDGAVTGTMYEQATNEIEISTASVDDALAVTVTLLAPDTNPYRECDEFAVGSYQILDSAGTVVAEGNDTDFAAIIDGQVVLHIPLDGVEDGAYVLQIQAFVGSKKADQPIRITGFWQCDFSK